MNKNYERPNKPVLKTTSSEHKVEEVKAEKVLFGKVCDCAYLNVRKAPTTNSDIVVLINHEAELKILCSFENDEWYKVVTSTGDEGYVMKQYVAVKE